MTTVVAQVDQRAVVQQILSTDPEQRSNGLTAVEQMDRKAIGPELRQALISALEQQNRAVRDRRDALARGEVVPRKEEDFYGRVAEQVVALRDPSAIESLTGALGTGLMVIRALAGFGDSAVQSVVRVVSSPQSQPHEANGGLIALRLMVEQDAKRQLSPR